MPITPKTGDLFHAYSHELEIFTGPDARRQALRYAMQKYGHVREVQLEQQGEAPRFPRDSVRRQDRARAREWLLRLDSNQQPSG